MWRSATLSSCSTCFWFFAAIFGRQTWYRVVSFTWAFCQGSCPPSGFVASGAWPLSESFEGLDGFEQVLPYRGWTSHHFFFRLLSATAGGSLPARWTEAGQVTTSSFDFFQLLLVALCRRGGQRLDKSPLLLSTSFSNCWWLFAGVVVALHALAWPRPSSLFSLTLCSLDAGTCLLSEMFPLVLVTLLLALRPAGRQ